MCTGEELRRLAESIIDSYESRVDTIHSLMSQAHDVLGTYQAEIVEMINTVRSNLAGSRSLRRKDFDSMIEGILERHRMIEEEASGHLLLFRMEEVKMVDRMRHLVRDGRETPFEEIEFIREEILTRQKQRELKIIGVLKRFQVEQVELKIGLMRLLDKGEMVRVKDLKTMIKAIRAQQSDTNQILFAFLDEFDRVRTKVQGEWQQVMCLSDRQQMPILAAGCVDSVRVRQE